MEIHIALNIYFVCNTGAGDTKITAVKLKFNCKPKTSWCHREFQTVLFFWEYM